MRKKVWLLFLAGPASFSGQDCVLGPGTAAPAQLQSRPWQGWGVGAPGRTAKQIQWLRWAARSPVVLEVLGPSCGPAPAGDFDKR